MLFQFQTIYLANTDAVAEAPAQTPVTSEAAPAETHATTESASHAEATSGGLGAIGIDGRALVFQLVNFAILFWVLKKVAYKPILKMLEDRRLTIEEGLKHAKEAAAAQAEAEALKAKALAEARSESEAMLAKSRDEASEIVRAAETKASKRADQIVAEGQERIDREAASVRKELRKELGGLVAQATEALIDERLDGEKDAQLIEKALRSAEGQV